MFIFHVIAGKVFKLLQLNLSMIVDFNGMIDIISKKGTNVLKRRKTGERKGNEEKWNEKINNNRGLRAGKKITGDTMD